MAEVTQQLSDLSFYTYIVSDHTRHSQSLIKIVLEDALILGHIDSNIYNVLQVNFPCIRLFYTLPKKRVNISPWPSDCQQMWRSPGAFGPIFGLFFTAFHFENSPFNLRH